MPSNNDFKTGVYESDSVSVVHPSSSDTLRLGSSRFSSSNPSVVGSTKPDSNEYITDEVQHRIANDEHLIDDNSFEKEEPTYAQLTLPNGDVIKIQVFKETMGDAVILDGRNLYSTKKVLMFDPGFNSTCSCASAVTYIDGDKVSRHVFIYRSMLWCRHSL